jgi:hypothetical protein
MPIAPSQLNSRTSAPSVWLLPRPGMALEKLKSKRRNGGTQALREEAAKSGAGGPERTDRDIRFIIRVAA